MLLRISSRRSLLLSAVSLWWAVCVRPYLVDRSGESVRDRYYRLKRESRTANRQTGKQDSIGPAHCPPLVTARCGVPDRPAGIYRDSVVQSAGYRRADPAVSVTGYTEPVGLSDSTDRLPSSASLRSPIPARVIRRALSAVESEQPGLFRSVYDRLTDEDEMVSIHAGPVSPDWHPEDTMDRAHGRWQYRWEPRDYSNLPVSDTADDWQPVRIGRHVIRTSDGTYHEVSQDFLRKIGYRRIQRQIAMSGDTRDWSPQAIMSLADDIVSEATVRWLTFLRAYDRCPSNRQRAFRGTVAATPMRLVGQLVKRYFQSAKKQSQAALRDAHKASRDTERRTVRTVTADYERRLAKAIPLMSDRTALAAIALLQSGLPEYSRMMSATNESVRQTVRDELARVVATID